MRYDISRADAAKVMVAIEAMGRLLFAAGAVEVLTGVPGAATVHSFTRSKTFCAGRIRKAFT